MQIACLQVEKPEGASGPGGVQLSTQKATAMLLQHTPSVEVFIDAGARAEAEVRGERILLMPAGVQVQTALGVPQVIARCKFVILDMAKKRIELLRPISFFGSKFEGGIDAYFEPKVHFSLPMFCVFLLSSISADRRIYAHV